MAAIELARDGAPPVGTVTFHGLLETSTPARRGEMKGKVLVLTRANDHLILAVQKSSVAFTLALAGTARTRPDALGKAGCSRFRFAGNASART